MATNIPLTGNFRVTCEYKRKGNWAAGWHTGLTVSAYLLLAFLISKCKCFPVELPVEPIIPKTLVLETACPLLTLILDKWQNQ